LLHLRVAIFDVRGWLGAHARSLRQASGNNQAFFFYLVKWLLMSQDGLHRGGGVPSLAASMKNGSRYCVIPST